MESDRPHWLLLSLLVAGSLYLRLSAIDWGAPFIYHADEHFILHPALDIIRTGDPDPHWFQYPSLVIYLQTALVAVLQPFVQAPLETNYLATGIGPWDALPSQWPFVLVGRVAVALFGAGGVVLLALAGARLFGPAVGAAAGALLMATPLHNESCHYLTTDVPSATLVTAALYAASARAPRWRLIGFLGGLAAGAKYTGGLALLAPVVMAVDLRQPGETLTRLTRLALGAILGFVVSTPYAIFDAGAFVSGLDEQRRNYMRWTHGDSTLRWYLDYLYRGGLGEILATVSALGAVSAIGTAMRAVREGNGARAALAVLLPPLLFLPWLASYPSRAERNLVVILPFLCLLAATLLDRLSALLRSPGLSRVAFLALTAVAVLHSGRLAEALNDRLLLPDTRTQALDWIEATLPTGTKIAREEYTPQVQNEHFDVTYLQFLSLRPYSWYVSERIAYLITSSNMYGRVLNPPHMGGEGAQEFYRQLFELPLAIEFAPGFSTGGPVIRIYKVPLGPPPA